MHRFLMTLISQSILCKSRPVALAVGLSLVVALMLASPGLATAQTTDAAPAADAAEEAPADPAAPPAEDKAADDKAEPEAPTAEDPEPSGEPGEEMPAQEDAGEAGPPVSEAADDTASVDDTTPLAEQVGPTTVTPVEDEKPSNWGPFLLFLMVVVGAFGLASGLASSLRVREYQTKLTIIFLSLFAAAAIIYSGWPPKLGIDLKGGVYLVYETGEKAKETLADAAIDPDAAASQRSAGLSASEMDKLVSAISKRINPGGVKEVVIRPFGQNQIEIVIPEVDESEIERYKEKITSAGTLEFRILANTNDHRELIDDAEKSTAQFVYMLDADGKAVRDEEGAPILRGWWVPVSEEGGEPNSILNYPEIAKRPRQIGDRTVTDVLVVKDSYDVTGGYLVRSSPDTDESGRRCVSFMFNPTGGRLFGGLTSDNTPDEALNFTRKLGIILDGYLFSAPSIQTQIRERGQITGQFSKTEIEDLVDVLNAGMLPTTLKEEPISQMATGPSLGKDTIERGRFAIGISMGLVLLFMLFYYRFAGAVACCAMLANLVLILGVMIFVKAAFTLPGIAGLVLTVGMAVDANVLIFERIREELDRQATLRMAIRNGFARATTTIVDANLTTLITGVVLYTVGTDQIKGFAVTLILGVTLSMFTAIYCSRVVFDIAEKKRWLKKLSMARIPLSGTVDFIGLRRLAGVASVTVILIGLVGVMGRGKGLMDIDFTGGVSVQTVFKEEQKIDDIRKVLNEREEVFEDLAISEMSLPDEPSRRFVINTARHDDEMDADAFLEEVKTTLEEVFGDKLVHHSMEIEGGAEAPAAEAAPAAPEKSDTGLLRSDLPGEEMLAFADDPTPVPAEGTDAGAEEKADAAEKEGDSETEDTATPAKPADPTAESAEDAPNLSDIEPVTWTVTFGEDKITHATLENSIREQMEALGTNAYVALTNPKYVEDGYDPDVGYDSWEVSISLPAEQGTKVLEGVRASVEATPVFPSSNTIGGKVASDTQWRAAAALLASLVFIVAYIWIRFQRVMFGLAAVVALVHDVLVTLGAIALTYYLAPFLGVLLIDEFKIGLPVLAAFLTIIGYSLNDTIVVFDRIREVRGKAPNLTAAMINKSLNQTLSRTLLTSFTTLIVVVILYAFGGTAIRVFAFSLVIGVIVGTYSSIFVASPVLLWIAQSSEVKKS
jgi:SecD/SecF fusion protein